MARGSHIWARGGMYGHMDITMAKKKMRRAIKNDLCIAREAETEKI